MSELYYIALAMFCGALLFSSVINGDSTSGLIGVGQYVFSFVIFPIVLLRRNHREAWIVGLSFLAAIVVICLHGISLIVFEIEVSERFVAVNGRLRGLVERTNELGALLAMTVPLVVVLTRVGWFPKWLAWSILAIIFYTVMLTGSNTGMGSYMFAFLGMMVLGKDAPRNFLVLAVLVAIMVGVVMVFGTEILPEIFQKRVVAGFTAGDIREFGTLDGRLVLTYEAFDLAEEYLFIGMGFDQFRELSSHNAPVHNAYLLFLTEGGVVALFGFLLLLVVIFARSSSVILNTGSLNGGLYLMVTILTYCIVLTALPHVYGRFLIMPWVVAMGITTTIPTDPNRQASKYGKLRFAKAN
ncbi:MULTISPECIES: O-antigen ligase family protein [Halocynthiibacter]|uniref:O-antigen ligase family protein n=1 Tax=Halocynthiibacter halioticoli TaxID=2986804 RepID=A0AAE3LRJ1_9RHOB|nr:MULTISPECIES: O-antigen ligase family protein [Halocynthiibacter]MCV6824504.1 O-antigen ligase family protein [Halocynthiibacter halioticoli]MCW4057505.1 O-antigen ligase family protein [Halocynthiibacter sp. SDUM655004]